jgi:hypothetical protein
MYSYLKSFLKKKDERGHLESALVRAIDWEDFEESSKTQETCVWTGKTIEVGKSYYSVVLWQDTEQKPVSVFPFAKGDDLKHPKQYVYQFYHFAILQRFRLYVQYWVGDWVSKKFKMENTIDKPESRFCTFLSNGTNLIVKLVYDFIFSKTISTMHN